MYRIYNGSYVDQDLCTAMCAFDSPNAVGSNCGFVVLVSGVCYLGSLNNETDVLAAPVAGADLQLKTCMLFQIHCSIRNLLYRNTSIFW